MLCPDEAAPLVGFEPPGLAEGIDEVVGEIAELIAGTVGTDGDMTVVGKPDAITSISRLVEDDMLL